MLAARDHARGAVLRYWLDGDAVVLARRSAPERVCSIAGSRTVDGAHRFGCRM
jgi:hypothetical protein